MEWYIYEESYDKTLDKLESIELAIKAEIVKDKDKEIQEQHRKQKRRKNW